MYVNFEFAALLPSPFSRVKKCAKFKTNIHLVSVDTFLYYLSSNTFRFADYLTFLVNRLLVSPFLRCLQLVPLPVSARPILALLKS